MARTVVVKIHGVIRLRSTNRACPKALPFGDRACAKRAPDIAVTRLKNGRNTCQPLDGNDLRALRALYRDRTSDEWVFMSERGPFTRDGFATLLKAAAAQAKANVHPHALRHACGHALAMKGRDTRLLQDWLGHRNIQHTSLYTDGISTRFKGVWD
jgi:type 1 fimbriae regulatory protein FimB/type 1 fimbriae regulatory protein FimE